MFSFFSRERKVNPECMQRYDPRENDYCMGGEKCSTCGFNVHEHARREEFLRSSGLTQKQNGLYGMTIKRVGAGVVYV